MSIAFLPGEETSRSGTLAEGGTVVEAGSASLARACACAWEWVQVRRGMSIGAIASRVCS